MIDALKSILKIVKWLLLSILISAIIIVGGFYLFLYGLQSHWFDQQDSDIILIRRMEYYANEKLPSCKVLKKENKERHHNIAIYKVDSIDFMKVHNNFNIILPEFSQSSNVRLIGETQHLIRKSLPKKERDNWSKNITLYEYNNSFYTKKIGFLKPNIIVLETKTIIPF